MATVKTVTVKASGGNYTSLSAALAGEKGNLVTLDRQLDIVCDPIVDSASFITFAGTDWTTDATHYVRIVGATNHNGSANAGYRLTYPAEYKSLINVSSSGKAQFLRFQNVVLNHTAVNASGDNAVILFNSGDGGQLQLVNVVIPRSPLTGVTMYGGNSVIVNTLIYGCNGTVVEYTSPTGTASNHVLSSSVFISSGANPAVHVSDSHSTIVAKDCYAYSPTGIAFDDASNGTDTPFSSTTNGLITMVACASSDSSGSAGLRNVPYSTATFTNVTSGSENFLPPNGSALVDSGVSLASEAFPVTTDITGATRGGTWEIGAFAVNAPPAVLSSPNATNVADVSATLSVTSTAAGPSIYLVLCSTNVAPTAAQIEAGTGGTIVKAYNQNAVIGVNTFSLTNLSVSTTYYAFFVQNNGGDSNITSSVPFTTTAAAPKITGISTPTPSYQSSFTITGSGFNATQSGGSVTIGGYTQTPTSWSDTSITVTIARGGNKYGTALNLVVTNGVTGVSSSAYGLTNLQPQTGWAFVDLSTPNSNTALRLTTTPDLASGDQIAYQAVAGTGGTVVVNNDATWSSPSDVTSFPFEAWTSLSGWGSTATQTISTGGSSAQVGSFGALAKASLSSISGFSVGSISGKNGFTI